MLATLAIAPFSVIGTAGFGASAIIIEESRTQAFEIFTSAITTETLKQKFDRLANTWEKEIAFTSSVGTIQTNQSYLGIIAMGKDALPFIFSKMQRDPNHWFVALTAITGVNPVVEDERGNVQAMTNSWLQWALKHGYVTS
jgi:hypothetical protein